jgi:hypothetical protein
MWVLVSARKLTAPRRRMLVESFLWMGSSFLEVGWKEIRDKRLEIRNQGKTDPVCWILNKGKNDP